MDFPSPYTPEKEKLKIDTKYGVSDYARRYMDAAINNYYSNTSRRDIALRMNGMYNAYNGIIDEKRLAWMPFFFGGSLEKMPIKFKAYKLARKYIDILQGTYLNTPIPMSVYLTNQSAIVEQLEALAPRVGLYHGEEYANKLKEDGVELFGGIPPAKPDDDGGYSSHIKTELQKTFQAILKHYTYNAGVLEKLGNVQKDGNIAAECHIYSYLTEKGSQVVQEIDPRDAIFVEHDRDTFCLKSPYDGFRELTFVANIISDATFTSRERELLKEGLTGGQDWYNTLDDTRRRHFAWYNNTLCIYKYYMEWDAFITKYYIVSENEYGEEKILGEYEDSYYVENKERLEASAEKRGLKIISKSAPIRWQCTRYGDNIYKYARQKQNVTGNPNDLYSTNSDIIHYLPNTVSGIRISKMELMRDIDMQYDIVQWQKTKEIAKFKGSIMTYDTGFLPKDGNRTLTMQEVLDDANWHGVMKFSSAVDGLARIDGKNAKDAIGILQIDLSNNIMALDAIGKSLEQMMRTITGISAPMLGETKASATVTNAQSDLRQSENIIRPFNLGFDMFTQILFNKIIEQRRIATAFMGNKDDELVLGIQGMGVLRDTAKLAATTLGVRIGDGAREQRIKDSFTNLAEVSMNNKSLSPEGYIDAMDSDELSEMKANLKRSFKEMNDIQAKSEEISGKLAEMAAAKKLEDEKALIQEQGAVDGQNIVLKGQVDAQNIADKGAAARINTGAQNENKLKLKEMDMHMNERGLEESNKNV